MARGSGDEIGHRVQVSRLPGRFDWRITYHSKKKSKKDMGDVYPCNVWKATRQEAEMAMWRTRHLDGNRGYDLRLQRFQALPDGSRDWVTMGEWKAGESYEFAPVTGIDPDWESKLEEE